MPIVQHRLGEQLETNDSARCRRLPRHKEAEYERVGSAQDAPCNGFGDRFKMGAHVRVPRPLALLINKSFRFFTKSERLTLIP